MNRVQELIDERMADLPVGLAKELLDACKGEADSQPLYLVTYVRVQTNLGNGDEARVMGEKRTFIAERRHGARVFDVLPGSVQRFSGDPPASELLAQGIVKADWLSKPMPLLLYDRCDEGIPNLTAIVTSIDSYRKRPRTCPK